MSFLAQHTYLWFCHWDLPFFIAFVGVLVWCTVRNRKKRKERDELEDRLKRYEDMFNGPSAADS